MLQQDWFKRAYVVLALCATTAIALPAQTFATLHKFDGADGAAPQATLIQGTDGLFYGTTHGGGSDEGGTIFRITRSGELMTLYNFCAQSGCTDGTQPVAGLVQATDGDFYGTTEGGGTAGEGTIFKITPVGVLTTLYSFCAQSGCTDGSQPVAGLIQATNGDFYGTTEHGGAHGYGTVFKLTSGGTLTTLYSFCSQMKCTDGMLPQALLVQATNGELYGTVGIGGANNAGTVFKITTHGALTTLYNFCSQSGCTDGAYPDAGLVQATDGDLYGTTYRGGMNYDGTVFRITQSGTLTTLYSFGSQSQDGQNPYAGLVQATDGNFYGTTEYNGANGAGVIFEITPSGTLTTLHNFDISRGSEPFAGLVQATNGIFYGTAIRGANGYGTVFGLSVGLGPFVQTQTTSGKVGEVVKVLGTDLTGATSISFNGAVAGLNVISPSLIVTTVPAGATSGKVQVGLPSGTLVSNAPFHVLP